MSETIDVRILDTLGDYGPLSVRELSDRLWLETCASWADQRGYDIAWGEPSEPLGARLLAVREAREAGTYAGLPHELRPRLVALERRGLVERIQVVGHRPMLWRVASAESKRATKPESA